MYVFFPLESRAGSPTQRTEKAFPLIAQNLGAQNPQDEADCQGCVMVMAMVAMR